MIPKITDEQLDELLTKSTEYVDSVVYANQGRVLSAAERAMIRTGASKACQLLTQLFLGIALILPFTVLPPSTYWKPLPQTPYAYPAVPQPSFNQFTIFDPNTATSGVMICNPVGNCIFQQLNPRPMFPTFDDWNRR